MVLGALAMVVVGTAWTPPLVEPSTSGRTFGQGPLEAVTAAASARASCGLGSVELAAMMMAPTYTEAGGPVPPPMALSRYDNVGINSTNANLFSFGQTGGAYINAFWSPGVGMWQFDSAGAWPFGAAGAIDSVTSANQAAATISYRWCNAPGDRQEPTARRKYAWGPWYGCSTTNTCEAIYASLVGGTGLNTAFDASVTRFGGMQQRTCDLVGVGSGLTCWYVNPALGQGSRGWTGGTYTGPTSVTPLPKPFYAIESGGREFRVWLPEDTGYDIGITGSKPITANARTSLTWSGGAGICDLTTSRGSCTPGVPPIGSLDLVAPAGPEAVRVAGWALDPDTSESIPVHVYADDRGTAISAGNPRPDVGAAFPGYGDFHGFDAMVPAAAGSRNVCAYGINTRGGSNQGIGCKRVTVTGQPVGAIDWVMARPGEISIGGWVTVPYMSDARATISVDGSVVAELDRTVVRPDVQAAFPIADLGSGFVGTVSVGGGAHRVCLTAGGAALDRVACRTVTVPTGSPVGSLDVVSTGPGSVTVAGWAFDPDTAAAIPVHVYVAAIGTALTADLPRADVGAVYPLYGPNHGFRATLPAGGRTQVCAYGINVGNGANVLLGCRTVSVPSGPPFGVVDSVRRTAGGIAIQGWAIDPDTPSSIPVHVYVGSLGYALSADQARPDVGNAYPGYGAAHGYSAILPDPGGAVTVCAYGIESAGAGTNQGLGCTTL